MEIKKAIHDVWWKINVLRDVVDYPRTWSHEHRIWPCTYLSVAGVLEFLTNSKVPATHKDFKEFDYEQVLKVFTHRKVHNSISHPFSLKSAYNKSIMEFTNFT